MNRKVKRIFARLPHAAGRRIEPRERKFMSTANLTAWDIDASHFPNDKTLLDKVRFAVGYAILAPSSHNTQPWRFIINGNEMLVCADRTRSLPNIDPYDRELVISCGAALFNLRVALAHFNIPVEISPFPQSSDPDVVARIAFPASGQVLNDLAVLFDAITKRATNRGPFVDQSISDELIASLRSIAEAEGANIRVASTLPDRERVAALIAEADRRQFDDRRFRRELASWIHPSRSADGMPFSSQSIEILSDAATPVAAMVIRTFDVGNGVAAAHEQLALGSPVLVILSTPMEDNDAWLATGFALERLLLVATKAGYAASFLNQPIEVPELRTRLSDELRSTGYPQLLLRLGRGTVAQHSPRRPLADVLI
jgi:hypothetical protein